MAYDKDIKQAQNAIDMIKHRISLEEETIAENQAIIESGEYSEGDLYYLEGVSTGHLELELKHAERALEKLKEKEKK